MGPDEYPDHYIVKAKRLRSRLTSVKEPVPERHFKDIVVQELPKKIPRHQADDLQGPRSSIYRRSRRLCAISTWTTCRATGARASLSRDVVWPCQWSQPLTPPASFATTAAKDIARAVARARQDLRRAEQRSRAEENEVWRKGKGHHEEMVFASQENSTQRRRLFQAGSVAPEGGRGICLLPPSALTLFIPRATRSRPSTSTTTSTAASSSEKRNKRHRRGVIDWSPGATSSLPGIAIIIYRRGLLEHCFWGR